MTKLSFYEQGKNFTKKGVLQMIFYYFFDQKLRKEINYEHLTTIAAVVVKRKVITLIVDLQVSFKTFLFNMFRTNAINFWKWFLFLDILVPFTANFMKAETCTQLQKF